MKLLSIDPGLTTGIAVKADNKYQTMELAPYQLVWRLVQHTEWDQVICEDFIPVDPKTKQPLISSYGTTTVKLVGGIEAICYIRDIPFTLQRNVDRIPFKSQALDLMISLYGKKHPRDHELDALAHLLRFEATHG